MTKLFGPIVAVAALMLTVAVPAAAQNRPLAPLPNTGLNISPFLEGWYENEDGTYTVSLGYLNRNEHVVRIPIGERNLIEPAQFSGMQPTMFLPGRNRGVFTVTLPAGATDAGVWWTIVNESGEVHKTPVRATAHGYSLDRIPRPFGSLPPRVALAEDGPWGWDPTGVTAERTLNASVGERVELAVWVDDVSERDRSDPRFEQAQSVRVVWMPHQAPPRGEVEFTRHETTPPPEQPAAGEGPRGRRAPPPPGPEEVMLPAGEGVARVYATFSQPGQYLIRAQADNWRSPDSSSGDQCCWSNAYVRVNVR